MNSFVFVIEMIGAIIAASAFVVVLRSRDVHLDAPPRITSGMLLFVLTLIHVLATIEHLGVHTMDRFVDIVRSASPILWLLLFDSWIKQQARRDVALSESRYRTIVEDQTEFVTRWKPDGTYLFVNDAYARYLNVTAQSLTGVNFLDRLPALTKAEILQLVSQLTPDRPLVTEERFKILSDGREVWQSWTNRGIFDPAGRLIAIQASGRDVTDRIRLEQALRLSEEKYRKIVESQTEFIVRCRPDGTRTYVNEAYARYYDTTPEKLIGTSFFDVLPEADLKQVKQKYAELTPENDSISDEHRTLLPDGSLRWHNWTDRGIFDEQGKLYEIQAIGRDITARKAAEEALRESEKRLSLALSGAQLGVWDWHIPTGKVSFDERWCRMLGYDPQEIANNLSAWEQLVHPDDMPHVMQVLRRHLDGITDHYQTEHRMRTRNGDWKWILDSGQVVERDAQGAPIRAVGTHMDIDEARRAAAEIESWKNRYEAAVRASGLVIYDWNTRTGEITLAGALDRLLGCTAQELDSLEKWTRRIHPDDLDRFLEAVNNVVVSGDVFLQEYRLRRDDGTYVETQDHGYYFTDAGGERIRMVGFLTDITERKEAERERMRTQSEFAQKQKMESIGHLASGIAHDFSNLLTAIQGHLALAYRGIQPDHPARRSLKMVEQAAQQGVEMTRSITAFVHKAPAAKAPCNLNDLASESMRMFRHLLPHSIEMELDLPETPPWCNASRSQLQQVAMNLILNSRDAMPDGGVLRISVRSAPRDRAVHWPRFSATPDDAPWRSVVNRTDQDPMGQVAIFSVQDTGSGMDERVMAHIFEPFFTTKDRQKGTGLGMAMVHGAVSDTEGWVNVASTPGAGTRIDIILPCCPAPKPDRPVPAQTAQVPPHRPRHIILLHERNFIGEIMATTLESAGYVACSADDAPGLISLAVEHRDELAAVIIDCDLLPESDDDAPPVLSMLEHLPKAPVIAVTANAAQFMDETLPDDFHVLPRPFQMAKLIDIVDRASGIISSGAQ